MSSGRGPATPVGIGVTATGVNIDAVVELRSRPELPGVDWHGLLSLFSRTLPTKCLIWPQEKLFIFRILFVTITFLFPFFLFFFSFSLFFFFCLGEAPPPPPRGFSARSRLCFKRSFVLKKFPYLFQP